MALLTTIDLKNKLEATRATLLSAANGDGIVSRDDFEQLNNHTEDPIEREFLNLFYFEFLLKLEDRSGVRVTEALIDRGVGFLQEKVIPNLAVEITPSLPTNQKIALLHDDAFQMAKELINFTANRVMLTPLEVSEQIEPLAPGLFFDDLGSEAGIGITPFFLEHPNQPITPESFIQALGVDPNTPQGVVSRLSELENAELILYRFIDQHDPPLKENAQAVVELMEENLSDFKVIARGEANLGAFDSEHPVYIIGRGKDGNLAGFESIVVWT